METFNKIIDKFKDSFTSKKGIERFLLYIGATILVITGLIFNIYADTKLNADSYWLFFGLLTGIAGAVFIYVGTTMNNFDIKTTGLVFNFVGSGLGLLNIVVSLVYNATHTVKGGFIIVIVIFTALGSLAALAGSVIELTRKINHEDED